MADEEQVAMLDASTDAWNKWRAANPSDKVDLSEADLSKAKLSGANLSSADLSGANLQQADLSGADLREADLEGARLNDVDLSGANLSGANLHRADLSSADLRGANLSGATLDHRTNFKGAQTEGCTIDRYQLERMDDHGGLSIGNRMVMNINDGVATLRASYSGFWQWIHLVLAAEQNRT